jgi:hypothetical protein
MAKSTDGIEKGSFQTSGVNDDVQEGEAKPRGGNGSAKMTNPKMAVNGSTPNHHFAHKRPVTGHG